MSPEKLFRCAVKVINVLINKLKHKRPSEKFKKTVPFHDNPIFSPVHLVTDPLEYFEYIVSQIFELPPNTGSFTGSRAR